MKKFLILLTALTCWSALTAQEQSSSQQGSRVVIGGEYFYVHTVQQGETIYSLGLLYGVEQDDIIANNPHTVEGLRAGETIKIPAPEPELSKTNIFNRVTGNRKTTVHTVNRGETAYSIAKRYGLTVESLIEANPGFDPVSISIGQKINIPKQLIGTATQTEILEDFNQYSEALSDVSPGFAYHLVERGETLYSLSRSLEVPIDTLRFYNPEGLAEGLKFGALLKYPVHIEAEDMDNESTLTEEYPENRSGDDGELPENSTAYVKDFGDRSVLNVALLLPMTSGQAQGSITDYYNGTLLALEDLKGEGISVNLALYDTRRSTEEVDVILSRLENEELDLIIGPVYEEQFGKTARLAYEKGIPIVSPLTQFPSRNPNVYQASPDPIYKYDKIKELISSDKNIVLLLPDQGADSEFIHEISPLLPPGTVKVSYSKSLTATAIQRNLSMEMENVIIIPTLQENTTEEIMAKISTFQNSLLSRTGRAFQIKTIGSPRWARFTELDKQYFFKLDAHFVTSYHADRGSKAVLEFDNRYLSAYQSVPTYSAYRGYDLTKIFVTALHRYGHRYPSSINRTNTPLLQVPYEFTASPEGKWVNTQWVRVRYRNDYIIETK